MDGWTEEWRERGKVGTGEWPENNGGKKRGQRTDGLERNEERMWDGEKEGKRHKKDRRGGGERIKEEGG